MTEWYVPMVNPTPGSLVLWSPDFDAFLYGRTLVGLVPRGFLDIPELVHNKGILPQSSWRNVVTPCVYCAIVKCDSMGCPLVAGCLTL